MSDGAFILIGFKHVGKTTVGRALAARLHVPFVDLDEAIVSHEHQSCREIVCVKGEAYFRKLETEILAELMHQAPPVLALGGGAPMEAANQVLIRNKTVVHLHALREGVFERILSSGMPAFFSTEDPWLSFNQLWDEREKVYQHLASKTVENTGPLDAVVREIIST